MTRPRRAAEYRDLIVAFRNGSPVRLSSVANVLDSVEDTRNYLGSLTASRR